MGIIQLTNRIIPAKYRAWMKGKFKSWVMDHHDHFKDFLTVFNARWDCHHYRLINNRLQLIGVYPTYNDITNGGKNNILDVYFSDGTQTPAANWRLGLIDASGFTTLAAADTMSSHAGWTELTIYSQATRPAWGPGEPASQTITNAAAVQFDITGTGTVQGLFVVTDSTKGGTSGTLWSTAPFSPTVPVVNGDQLRLTYTLGC